jgi:hypothetical protein
MSDKKQTAVEWLIKILDNQKNEPLNFDEWKIAFEYAKEIEKKQIIEAHGDKQKLKSNPGSIVTYGYNFTGEMYYNQTFKNTENETI